MNATVVRGLLNLAFQVSLVSYLGFFILEKAFPGFVSMNFDLNIIFYSAIVLGVLTLIRPLVNTSDQLPDRIGRRDFLYVFGITVLSVWFANTQIPTLGFRAWVVIVIIGMVALSGVWVALFSNGNKDGSR